MQEILSRSLKVLIETDGIGVTEDLAQKIALFENASKNVDWIVDLDAFSADCYKKIRFGTEEDFEKAKNAVEILSQKFPNRVYPQFVRMKENEDELESFFRFWQNKESPSNGKVIIKKYDSLCSTLPDRKVADLSPLVRLPCWHQRRDLAILCDGSVPLCRSSVRSRILGNALEDGVQKVWENGAEIFAQHAKAQNADEFQGLNEACGGCDEFYTFSF